MIIEIPTAEDFHKAGLNQLHLAWRFALQVTEEFEESQAAADHLSDDEAQEASRHYWNKSQPALANSYSLVQQAMEMALKARIARVSPYLLIARDPKEWPRGVDTKPIPFSAFRTLDAADLLRVHNAFSTPALDVSFQTFWDNLRRERNKVMHSVSGTQFDAAVLKSSATPYFVDVNGQSFSFDSDSIAQCDNHCGTFKEPLNAESELCSWCQIDDGLRH